MCFAWSAVSVGLEDWIRLEGDDEGEIISEGAVEGGEEGYISKEGAVEVGCLNKEVEVEEGEISKEGAVEVDEEGEISTQDEGGSRSSGSGDVDRFIILGGGEVGSFSCSGDFDISTASDLAVFLFGARIIIVRSAVLDVMSVLAGGRSAFDFAVGCVYLFEYDWC